MDQDPRNPRLQVVIRQHTQGASSPCDEWIWQAADRTLQPALRIEAVGNIARECADHVTFQRLGWIVEAADDDLEVRCAIVRAFPRWGDQFVPLGIVRTLALPGVRAAALEALENVGPATGDRASRLVARLASFRNGDGNPLEISGLCLIYGGDPRLLTYLNDLLRTGNRWERALAASASLGLGEVETALDAARDPEPRVRKSLAAAIGRYREQRGAPSLDRLLEDPDDWVASEARKSVMLLNRSGQPPLAPNRSPVFTWRPLLKELSEFRLAAAKAGSSVPEPKVKTQWLGEPGATALELEALERRAGRPLPPSYRSFLAESNGFEPWNSLLGRLYAAGEVDWFSARNSFWAEAYRDTYPNLGSCLQVSEAGDNAVILLNPDVVSPDGEWQTYFFANWIPGATAYGSFREFMEDELNSRCEWKNR